jgi:hypothetical protein
MVIDQAVDSFYVVAIMVCPIFAKIGFFCITWPFFSIIQKIMIFINSDHQYRSRRSVRRGGEQDKHPVKILYNVVKLWLDSTYK